MEESTSADVSAIRSYLSERTFKYVTAVGTQIIQHQKDRISILFHACRMSEVVDDPNFIEYLSRAISATANHRQDGDETIIEAAGPILNRDPTPREIDAIHNNVDVIRGMMLFAYRDAIVYIATSGMQSSTARPIAAACMLIDYFKCEIKDDIIEPSFKEFTSTYRRNLASIGKESEYAKTKIANEIGIIQENRQSLESLLNKTREEIEAITTAARTKLVLEEPIKTWGAKARGHTWAFWLGSLLLLVMSGATIAACGYIALELQGLLTEIAKANPLAVTALLAIPLIAVFMLLRIVARLVTSNLALAQDARQRRALADMYLRLVSEAATGMDAESRRIALSALFRAAPGQPIDEPVNHPVLDMFNNK